MKKDVLKHFDLLSHQKMEIIPLTPGGKNPIQDGWQLDYNPVEARACFERNPHLNLGLRLGAIVDVEGDSPHANRLVNDLIGDYAHPSYSSRKSLHHLFLNPDPRLTRIVFQDVEFRGYRHQSVLPPSEVMGVHYSWKTVVFPIPPMPDRLLKFFERIKGKKAKQTVKPGHMKLPCVKCRIVCYLHKKRFDEELVAFKSMGLQWHCQKCRPIDIRGICRKMRSKFFEE